MGQFSWFTQDDKSQIVDDEERNVYMVDPRDGTVYEEKCYEGYGMFGGRDFYELLADINKDIILDQNVKNWKDYDRDVLKSIIYGEDLKRHLFEFKGMSVDDVKRHMMDLDQRCCVQPNNDGKWPTPDVSKFDAWFDERCQEEIDEHIERDEKYTALYSKDWKDLTEEELREKRHDGIHLWYCYVEPDQHAKYAERLNAWQTVKTPLLLRDPKHWLCYTGSYPKPDPDQGWIVHDDAPGYEEDDSESEN